MSESTPTKALADRLESSLNTGKHLEQVIAREEEQPDLVTLLSGPTSNNYITPLLPPQDEFKLTNEIQLPPRLINKVRGVTQCFERYGVFPEINKAWAAIDNHLFVWSLVDADDIYEYHDQDQAIANCALVKPRPNVFRDDIKYLLVVSTPLQVILLAVEVIEAPMRITIEPTNVQVSSDDEPMKVIQSTDDGRIFMIGRAGALYEAYYDGAWAGVQMKLYNKTTRFLDVMLPSYMPRFLRPEAPQPIKSMAIDNERKVLYLLTENNAIEVIYLGGSFRSFKPIFKHTTIVDNAIQMCRQQSKIYNASDFIIDSIHVISKAESKKIHLMAITTAGFRLYFSHIKDSFRYTPPYITASTTWTAPLVPNTLELGHIRIPPPEPPRSPDDFALTFSNTYYDCGIAISVHPKNERINTIHVIASAAKKPTPLPSQYQQQAVLSGSLTYSSSRQSYLETDITLDEQRMIVAIAEDHNERRGRHYLKEISQQLADPPRRFILLTKEHALFYAKLRPVDILLDIIIETCGHPLAANAKAIQAFYERYGQVEACAMCLSIICSSDIEEVVTKATELFFEYGGMPTAAQSTQVTANHLGRAVGQTDVTYSGKHDGFLLHFARIISPAWKTKVFANCGEGTIAEKLRAEVSSTICNTQMNLEKLRAFVESNPCFHDARDLSDSKVQFNRDAVILELAERKSVHEIYLLLVQTIEAIAFFRFILSTDLQQICAYYLTPDQQQNVQNLDLNTILTSVHGREVTRELVIATIAQCGTVAETSALGYVSKTLEANCSAFFGQSDILFFKGIEYVRKALRDDIDYERRYSLKQSLHFLKLTADEITDQKLSAVGDIYVKNAFHAGVIELCLERARKADPQNQALLAFESMHRNNYNSTSSTTVTATPDESSMRFLNARVKSYQFITTALSDAECLKRYNRVPADRRPIADINMYVKHVYDTAFESTDRLFHYYLYNWFKENNMIDELISLDSPHLIPYFKNYVNEPEVALKFLWRYYRVHSNFIEAARCLEELASLPDPNISPSSRIEYLALALVQVRCVEVAPVDVDLAAYTQQLNQQLEQQREQAKRA